MYLMEHGLLLSAEIALDPKFEAVVKRLMALKTEIDGDKAGLKM